MPINVLKRLRASSGLSLRELSAKSNVDQKTISLLENNRRKAQITTLAKLADALNEALKEKNIEVKLDDLLELLDTGAVERGKASQAAQASKRDFDTSSEHSHQKQEIQALD